MAEPKTKPTDASIDDYLASRASPEQLTDCKAVMAVEPLLSRSNHEDDGGVADRPRQVQACG